jgi:hypothetical protein
MFKNFFINCDEATTICDKSQYNEATLLDKVKLNFHFLKCKVCAIYSKQNTFLSSFYRYKAKSCKEIQHRLTDLDKAALKKTLESKI